MMPKEIYFSLNMVVHAGRQQSLKLSGYSCCYKTRTVAMMWPEQRVNLNTPHAFIEDYMQRYHKNLKILQRP